MPFAKDVDAVKPFVVGGVDAVIVSDTPPWSPMLKFWVAVEPTVTLPKLRVVGTTLICAGGAADPDTGTPKLPALVSRIATPPKTWTKSPEDPGGE